MYSFLFDLIFPILCIKIYSLFVQFNHNFGKINNFIITILYLERTNIILIEQIGMT